ncbi:hypothetical protein FA10DRAFT_295328 [Acaromyces ingoldii]|uniref:Uncharacterized protein n=1 Tax=Acaromyces ingoldii TaxID=215250 RepID=A0A316YJS6_9BASI|nr:hypothetical protein FA10DRAFT_295328 [Acaromyces ingoldii]PWN89451.1 hypothetical protein FA10DRAFT_295328 [Acaromyces ingoldii]
MKSSSFILIVILLHAITFVASAEEDGGVNLVKRTRTTRIHQGQFIDDWFANLSGEIPLLNVDDGNGNGNDSHLQTSPIKAQVGASQHPQRKTVTKGSSSKRKSSTEHSLHSSQYRESKGPPSTSSSTSESEEWDQEDAHLTYSSSAQFEDLKSQGTSSASYPSQNRWDPRQAQQNASLTARTRASLSKAVTKPDALDPKHSFTPRVLKSKLTQLVD